VASSSGSVNAKAVIYKKTSPITFMAVGSIVSCSTAGWYNSIVDVVLPPDLYYIGLVEETTSPYLLYYWNSVFPVETGQGTATYANPIDFVSGGGNDYEKISVYVTYIPIPIITGIQSIQF
jgi:hypothetical protein